MIDELTAKYEEIKGIIDVLPTNTKYNRKRKYDYCVEEIKNDEKRLKGVKSEIEKRISHFSTLKQNEQISLIDKELETCSIVNEWNPYNTPYEKMHLDYYLYQLSKYYKEDLTSVNECIRRILDAFKKVSITVKEEDFNFNKEAKEYMGKILSNASFDELDESFEDLYWKNPEIIKTIEINFKSIYLKYEKFISKFYELRHEEFLKNHKDEEVYNKMITLNHNKVELINRDPYINFNHFVNNDYSVADFKDIDNKKNKYFVENTFNYENLVELYNVLNEYKIIVNYKYLFMDMREKLEKKSELKNQLNTTLKKLSAEEKKLDKINKKKDKKPLFGKKKNDEKYIFNYKASINAIMDLYKELDNANFNELVYTKLSQDSVLLDILKLITSNYIYFVNKTYEVNEESLITEINEKFDNLRKYTYSNNFILLDNVCLLDELQMKQLIVDRFKLNNINLLTDQLLDDSLETTIKDIKNILDYENILLSGLKLEDISLYLEYQKLQEN